VGGLGGATRLTAEYIADMNAKIRGMAEAFGSSVIWWRQTPVNPAMISGHCLLSGIVPLVVEAGGGGQIDFTIEQGVECTLNILKHLGMIDGELVLPKRQIMVERYIVYRSLHGGFYLQEDGIVLGAEVRQGQLLGRVIDPLTSEVLEECRAPSNGIIISRRLKMPINPGGYIAHIADVDSMVWSRDNS
jgi:predicted deacylase